MQHADLDALIDGGLQESHGDDLTMRRAKKRRLALRDLITRLESALEPKEPA